MHAKVVNGSKCRMECAMVAKPITINKAHCMCRHMGQVEARKICEIYGQVITKSGFKQCQHCGKAKAKQLAVVADNEEHIVAGAEGHQVFIDTSSVKHRSEKKKMLSKPYWMMIELELTNFKISEFLVKKNELQEKACEAVCKFKLEGVNVTYVWLDNAGENKVFATLANSKEWNLQLQFEFTGLHALQRNYLVKVEFATLWGRLRAMFDTVSVPEEEKYKLLREGIHHLTFLDGLIIKEIDGKKLTKFGNMHGKDPKIITPMRIWGEAGIVKVTGKIKSKLKLKGSEGLFVGYTCNRASDTYRMYLLDTNRIHETRDVQWGKRMYFEPEKGNSVHAVDSVELISINMLYLCIPLHCLTLTRINR
jgi:hypothetical protein